MVPDYLIASAGTVCDEVAVISIKNPSRVTLRGSYRTRMVKQLPKLVYSVTNVSPEHIFTKKLVKHLSYRTFQKGYTTRMTRAMPGVRAVLSVVQQSLEKRGLNTL